MNLSVTLWPQDAAILMGADRRKSTYTLWAEKRGSVPVHRLREPDQRRQLALAERFGKRTGLEPEPDIGEYTRGFLFAEGHWKIRGKSAVVHSRYKRINGAKVNDYHARQPVKKAKFHECLPNVVLT